MNATPPGSSSRARTGPSEPALHAIAVVGFYGVVYVAFFGVVLFQGRELAPGDALIQNLPLYHAPRTGWTSLLFSGYPLQGDPQAMQWYPISLLLSRVPHSWNLFVLSAYVLASSFTYGYVYRLTESRTAAALSGLVFGLNDFSIRHLGHTNMIHSLAWMPAALWCLEEIRRGGGLGWCAGGALAFGLCALGGHPQIFAHCVLLAGGYWGFWLWQSRSAPPWRQTALAVSSLALGLGMAAILLLPMVELAGESIRADVGYRHFVSGSVRVLNLPQLVLPGIYGGWTAPVLGVEPRAFFARGNPSELGLYTGLLPLVFATACWPRRQDALVKLWLIVAVVALLFALGRQVHAIAPLYLLPGYNRFRVPARHLAEFQLAMSVLSGLGVAHLQRLDVARRRALLRRGVAIVVALLVAALLTACGVLLAESWAKYREAAGVARVDAWPWANPTVALHGAALAAGSAIAWRWCRSASKPMTALLLGVVIVDLGCSGWLAEWRKGPDRREAVRMPPELASLRATLRTDATRLASLGRGHVATSAPPLRSLLWDIPNASGYGPLVLARYAALSGVGPYGMTGEHRALEASHLGFDLLAVRYLLVARERAHELPADFAASQRWRQHASLPGVEVYENRRALPRAWLVGETLQLDGPAILAAVESGRLPDGTPFDPRRTALLESSLALEADCGSSCGRVELSSIAPTRLELRVHASAEAVLVQSDIDYPGWTVRVDGAPAAVLRVDSALRGVRVPPGEHDVVFEFRSRSFALGAALSASSLLLVGAAWLRSRSAARRSRR